MEDGAMNNHYGKNKKGRCVNMYDVRLDDTNPDCGANWPPDLEYVTTYLQRQDVMSRIHADGKKSGWTECSDSVFETFRACHSEPSIKLLPDLLRQIPIVLYSGEYDLICNHWATETMIDAMIWNNGTGFVLSDGTLAPTESWSVEGEPAGLIRTARNLTYILFYNSSHMVPYNYAHRSRVMLHKFMQLDLISVNKQTTKKNIDRTNLTTHRASKRSGLIALVIIIIIVALMGLAWFFIYRQHQSRTPTPFSIIRLIRSKTRHVERQQWMVYSLLNDSDEDLHVPDGATLV
jgi:carboxypeptidase D